MSHDEYSLLGEDASKLFGARQQVFRGGQFIENLFQRTLTALFQKLFDGSVGDNRSFMNDHYSLADSLDDIENVRTINDGLAFAGQRSD